MGQQASQTTAGYPGNPWLGRIPYLVFLTMVIFFAFNPFSLLDFPLDDAWIHRVYSKSFAYGHGFEYNPGQQEAGSTSPLWSIVTAPAHWLEPLGIDAVVLAIKLFGVLLGVAVIGAIRKTSRILGGTEKSGIIAATVCALDPRLVFSAFSGMESCLVVVLWLWAVHCLLKNRLIAATILMSLTPTARPEALVVLPLYALAVVIFIIRNKWNPWHLSKLCILPVPMLVWSLFCKMANGHWLPTTFYMKSTSPEIGLNQFADAWVLLGLNGPLPSLAVSGLLVLLVYLLMCWQKHPEALLLLMAAPLAYLFGVLFSREFLMNGYYWIRWTDPATLLITAAAALALGMISVRFTGWKPKALILAAVLLSLPHFIGSFTAWRSRLITDCRSINLITVQAGKWIDQNTPSDAVIGVNDAGATRFFGKRKTLDLIGLNNADIAFKRIRPENAGIIDYLAITPVWFLGTGLYENLPECAHFSIPAEEYTITSNKGQSELVIFRCQP